MSHRISVGRSLMRIPQVVIVLDASRSSVIVYLSLSIEQQRDVYERG